MRVQIKWEGRNKGLPEKIKGTSAEEENEGLRGGEVKGADSAKGENKMHEGENKHVKKGKYGGIKRHKKLRRKNDGKNKRCR